MTCTALRALVGLALGCVLQAGLCAAAERPDRFWVGPMAFQSGRTLREDYFRTLTNPAAWPTVLAAANVFKSYLMILPEDPVPGKPGPELSDEQLRLLATFLREHRLKVAFEVGGLRTSAAICGDQAGERYADVELRHLRRWLRAGGALDYLTTDHAVMMNMRGPGFPGPGLDPDRPCQMTVAELTEELADYFGVVRREVPGVRLGVIESLGFFQVRGPDGREYPRTDPLLPPWEFGSYFDGLLRAMDRHGLELDHFHIDFGFEGVQHDGRATGELDFGRVLGVESYVRSTGVRAGLIVNAFHDQAAVPLERAAANREVHERTRRFLDGYLAAGGRADHLVLQTWQPYPDRTGPEDEPHTVLNVARDLLQVLTAPP